MSVAARLVLGTVGILIFAVLVLVSSSRTSLRRDLERQLQGELLREAALIQDALPDNPQAWARMVGRWAADRSHRVTLLDADGRPLVDNQVPAAQLALHGTYAEFPEVREALAGRVGADRRREGVDAVLLFVAVPGTPIVRLTADLHEVETMLGQSSRALFLSALLALIIGSALALVAGRAIARPLTLITAAARAVPAGLAPRFPRSGITEIDQLSHALREMHEQLEARLEALRHEQAESGLLVDAMSEGVLASDDRGRIVTANPAARRLLGYQPDEPMPDLPELFRAKPAREVVSAVLSGGVVEEREVDLDGRVVALNARPLPSGGAVLVLHDLTQLRRLEAVRRDFVANVSHELKTPLTSILGYAETLLSEDPDLDTRRRFLRIILSNARRMQLVVDDQLNLSRIESGRWQPQPEFVDVAALVRESWGIRADREEAQAVRFATDIRPGGATLMADPEAIRQILGNLLDNAIRYTPRGGTITCRSEPDGGGVLLSVTDTGTGIGREHLPRIFERYYRVDAGRARKAGGTGLGLAIVKHLVEAHGGRVSAQSELGRGTEVRAWFPTPS